VTDLDCRPLVRAVIRSGLDNWARVIGLVAVLDAVSAPDTIEDVGAEYRAWSILVLWQIGEAMPCR